jgi:hypothetical protein
MSRVSRLRASYYAFALIMVILGTHNYMKDDDSDAENLWGNDSSQLTAYSDIIDEKEWNRLRAIKLFSLQCANCSVANPNLTLAMNMTVEQFHSYESFLRMQIARLNSEQPVRNLDRFDLRADSDGLIVIVVQVWLFHPFFVS